MGARSSRAPPALVGEGVGGEGAHRATKDPPCCGCPQHETHLAQARPTGQPRGYGAGLAGVDVAAGRKISCCA